MLGKSHHPHRNGLHDVGTMIVVFIIWVRRDVC